MIFRIVSLTPRFASNIPQDPVLGPDDVDRLSRGANTAKPLGVLKKVRERSGQFTPPLYFAPVFSATSLQAQRHTLHCLLSCVSAVTSLCPHREEALLQRLMRTLTRVWSPALF